MPKQGSIRVGIGGWTYEPWRKTFYPKGLSQKKGLEYASTHLTAIEINGTYYSTQKPAVFAKWRDVRHESFMTPEFLALARKYNAATVFADSDDYPSFADVTADFVYARLMRTQSKIKTGYAPKALDAWAKRARTWAAGREPADLP